ncbi:MAG TPA: enoyl-CoA hydratase-related protein [Steroidobacteraceae bacterium]|nr:enoyl-CoA hydratase-related protein [Steroidobacteraceae bacterium]
MTDASRIPVIVGVGEFVDRPERVTAALEPVALMERAIRAAVEDSGAPLLREVDSVDLVGLITWRYRNPVSLLCERLGIAPSRQVNSSMGGETPIRLVHEAALRIATGNPTTAVIVGGEAMNARNHARKERVTLPWTPLASKADAVRFASDTVEVNALSKALGMTSPTQLYPLYEMATQVAWRQTPAEGLAESASLWSQYAAIAAKNRYAWIKSAPSSTEIREIGPDNRLISWPYPKLMVANPSVNQAAAIILTSLATARSAGVPSERIVYIWGGAAAAESEDYLERDRYDRSTAQAATLARAVEIAGGDATRFGKLELYSCFPVVPKMALRHLGLDPLRHPPTVTGGLTFFGGPLNNYMSHAVCAMVRALRASPGELGLLYAQGGIVTKHHALVVSTRPGETSLAADYSVQATADAGRGPTPTVIDKYVGPAKIETYTILYARDGDPLHGVVVLRTPEGARTLARVMREDEGSMSLLVSSDRSAVGADGHVRIDTFGHPIWEAGPLRDRKARALRFAAVEREGSVTLVTINRPESMNALHPGANAELAEIFDEFVADPSQWVAILTGAGERAFSSGNDLKFTATAMSRGESVDTPLTGFAGLTSRFDLVKPVIAAVNGVAMGGGFEIALACDLIVASDNAVFALPEPKVGLAALAGGLLRLPQQIGLKRAMALILTGRRVSAAQGLELGFVNEVTAPADLLATARRWAQAILECSPMSIRASKQIVQQAADEPSLEAAYRNQHRYTAVRALFRSADIREGPLAFAQKRPPRWKGE